MKEEANEETKDIIKALSSSPDFLASLQSCIDYWEETEADGKEVNFAQLSLYMFCQGYLSSLNYERIKYNLKPFDLKPYMPCN